MSTTDIASSTASADAQREPEAPSTKQENVPSPVWRWFWLGLLATAVPLLIPYFTGLWANPSYRYFPFALGAVAWLAYTRSDGYFYPPRGWLSWSLIVFGLLAIVFGTVVQFPWFASVALVCFCGTMLYAMRGPDDETLGALVLPLLTVVQLVRADALLVRALQNFTTWFSSVLLDGLAVPHAVANNVIQLSDRELFVAEACSGIQSVFTLGLLALLIVAWQRRRVWMVPIYLGISCVLAVFANVIRVTIVAIAANSYEADLAQGWPHELLGYIALAVAFGFLLSFDHLIATLLHRIPVEIEFNPFIAAWNFVALPDVEEETGRGTTRDVESLIERDQQSSAFNWAQKFVRSRTAQVTFAAVAGVICVASLAQVVLSRRPANMVRSDKELVFDPPNDLLDDSLVEMSVVGHVTNRGYENPRLGANSDIWTCQWEGAEVQFVLSQPHQGWHELCNCYERLDWMLLDRDIKSPEDLTNVEVDAEHPDALSATYVVARFKQLPSQYGYLLFSGIGSDGTLVDAPDAVSAFTHRVWNRIDSTGVWQQTEVIMLQMWVTSPEKIGPKRLRELEREYIAVRAKAADAIAANAGREFEKPATAKTDSSPKVDRASSLALTNRVEDARREPPQGAN